MAGGNHMNTASPKHQQCDNGSRTGSERSMPRQSGLPCVTIADLDIYALLACSSYHLSAWQSFQKGLAIKLLYGPVCEPQATPYVQVRQLGLITIQG